MTIKRLLTTTPARDLLSASKIRLSDGSSFFLRKSQHTSLLSPDKNQSQTHTATTTTDLPPLVYPCGDRRIYITQPEKKEMQKLRDEKWSTRSLARKFNCTDETVETYTTLSDEMKKDAQAKFNVKFDAMTWTEKVNVVNRIRRKATW